MDAVCHYHEGATVENASIQGNHDIIRLRLPESPRAFHLRQSMPSRSIESCATEVHGSALCLRPDEAATLKTLRK